MIKHPVFAFLFWIFISTFSFAQNLTLGPRVGLNLSRINGIDNNRTRPGTVLGAFVGYDLCKHLGISADVLVSAKGNRTTNKLTSNTTSEIWDSYANLVYLEIPVLANIYLLNKDHLLQPKLFAGAAPAFKLSASESIDYRKDQVSGDDSHSSTRNSVSGSYKNMDVGIIIGGGFNYQMSATTNFIFDARYTYGLSQIQNAANITSSLFNRNVSILLGVGYRLGK